MANHTHTAFSSCVYIGNVSSITLETPNGCCKWVLYSILGVFPSFQITHKQPKKSKERKVRMTVLSSGDLEPMCQPPVSVPLAASRAAERSVHPGLSSVRSVSGPHPRAVLRRRRPRPWRRRCCWQAFVAKEIFTAGGWRRPFIKRCFRCTSKSSVLSCVLREGELFFVHRSPSLLF